MKRLIIILGLASLFFSAHSAVVQGQEVTASEVVDRETLKAFVEGAKDSLESAANFAEVLRLVEVFRSEGDWKDGSIYLVVLTPEGLVQFHGANVAFEDKNVLDLEEARGVKIVQEMLAAAAGGGGFVEYYWDDPSVEEDADSPKLTYATPVTIRGQEFIVTAGFYMDLSGVDAEPNIFEILEVTARDVVDRETLKAFVEGLKVLVPIIEEKGYPYLATVQGAIRTEGEDFKYDSIYIFVINTDGVAIIHGADPSLDGQNLIDLEDVNGVKIVQEIIAAGVAGGGFVEYYWDNPAVEGDEDTHSPKLTYAIAFNIFGQDFVVGAGIYLDSDTAFDGAGLVDVQVVGDGDVSGLTVEVSRSIAGRVPNYAWGETTDEMGRAVVRVMADDQSSVNGMYQARLRSTDGATIAGWSSIPIVPGSRVTYEVNLNGDVRFINPFAASLSQNHPNPFNPATTIRYSLGKAVDVRLVIYNALGQEVRLLVQQFQPVGDYTVVWDGRDAAGRQVSTGMYMYRLQAGADVVARKMLLAK
jgi:hypothetical protein